MANIIFGIYLGYICDRPENQSFFVGKTTKSICPWTRDSQCKNSADSLAENTTYAPKLSAQFVYPWTSRASGRKTMQASFRTEAFG